MVSLIVFALGILVGAVGILLAVVADSRLKAERKRIREGLLNARAVPMIGCSLRSM